MKSKKLVRKISLIVIVSSSVILMIVLGSLIAAIPVLLLWNWLMPEIFGLIKINLFQAWGLTILCAILFKSSPSDTNKKKAIHKPKL